jgi:hypothetical protein
MTVLNFHNEVNIFNINLLHSHFFKLNSTFIVTNVPELDFFTKLTLNEPT